MIPPRVLTFPLRFEEIRIELFEVRPPKGDPIPIEGGGWALVYLKTPLRAIAESPGTEASTEGR